MSYRGKKAGGKASNPFERMMQEQCNKPVAAKSAGIVGKWGATSFTSVRATSDKAAAGPKPKKFFKSRAENSENSGSESSDKPATKQKEVTKKIVKKVEKEQRSREPIKVDKKDKPGWSSGSAGRPPLERSPLHPSRSPLHPSPSSNPSTTPPRSRSQSKNKGEDMKLKENKQVPKSAKDQMFDSLVAVNTTKNKKEEKRKRKVDEDGGGPARIKLKISVNRSPDKSDSTYKVIRKEDDLLSVCSQSSEASSEAGSLASSDVSNGFQHKYHDKRSNHYFQEPVVKSADMNPPVSGPSVSQPRPEPSSVKESRRGPALESKDQPSKVEVSSEAEVPEQLTRLRNNKTRSRDKAVLEIQSSAQKPAADQDQTPLLQQPKRRQRGAIPSEIMPVKDIQQQPVINVAQTQLDPVKKDEKVVVDSSKRRLRGGKEASPAPVAEKVAPEAATTAAPPPARKFFKSKGSSGSVSSITGGTTSSSDTKSSNDKTDKVMEFKHEFDLDDLDKPKIKKEESIVKSSVVSKSLASSGNNTKSTTSLKPVSAPKMVEQIIKVAPNRSPSPEFSLELPKIAATAPLERQAATSEPQQAAKPATQKKKIFFKSRNKDKEAGTSKPSSKVEEGKWPLKAAATPMEPPRVPPVSEHFVQVTNTVSEASASNEVTKILSTVKSPPRTFRSVRKKEASVSSEPEPVFSEPSKVPSDLQRVSSEPNKLLSGQTQKSKASIIEGSALSSVEEEFSSQDTLPSPEDEFIAPSISSLSRSKASAPTDKPAKKTFFKSKKAAGTGLQPKAMSLYKHNVGWNGGDFKKQNEAKSAAMAMFDDGDFSDGENENLGVGDISLAPSKIQRVATYPTTETNIDDEGDLVTQVKCPKSYKPLFTVIKNVKKGHELNDQGEDQEFQDDVEYIVDGLNAENSIPLRCMVTISLASKCMKPNFRMHLRAHSVVDQFFSKLQDAPDNASLALCTATVMFVLSQDRLNMDLDRDSLKLMLNLLDTDSKIRDLEHSGLDKKELQKNKQKVIDICAEMKKMGHATSLNLDLISADHLSMETLLSMTSQRSGEWFKEELRELGGIGHLARTVSDCVNYLTIKPIDNWTEMLKDKLKKANRILRVLENVSHENEENCNYLLEYKIDNVLFTDILQKFFHLLDTEVQLNPSTDLSDKDSIAVHIRGSLFSMIRVLINLAYDYNPDAQGSLILGTHEGMMHRSLRCLFIIPFWFVPLSKRFECLILALTLMVNLVETCVQNRQLLMESMAAQKELGLCVKEEPRLAIEDLVQMYVDREELATISEQKTDNILDDVEEEVQEIDPKDADKDKKDTLEETVQKLVNKAGSHMESCIIAAYIGLVLGYIIQDCDQYESTIREYLPSNDFKSVVNVLEKLSKFMAMTSSGSSYVTKSIKGTQKIIKYLEKIDAEPEDEEDETMDPDTSNLDISFDMTQDSINLPETTADYSRTQFGSQYNHFEDF